MPGVEILNQIKEAVPGAFEAYHVTEYVIYRESPKSGVQEVRIEIHDAGPSRAKTRYSVIATSKDGHMATGNPAESIDIAMAIVHWNDLD